ncbi:MAG TPA: hypothetical protein VIP77_13865 [Jiangellaceae bacterium]
MSARDASAAELFDELKKAVLRYVEAEEKLAAVEALVAKAERQPDRRPRDRYGPVGRATIPTVRADSLRKILSSDA